MNKFMMPEYTFSIASIIKLLLVFNCVYGCLLLNRPRYTGLKWLLLIAGLATTLDLTQNVFNLHQELAIATVFTLILGPGYYWFIKGLISPVKFQWQNLKHLLPAIIALFILNQPQIVIAFGTLSQLAYGYVILRLIKNYHKAIQSETSFAESLNLNWVKYAMVVLILSIVFDLIRLNLQPVIPNDINEVSQIISNGIAVIVTSFLVIKLNQLPEIFSDFSLPQDAQAPAEQPVADALAEDMFQQLHQQIMEQRWFLTPRLTLRMLSELTGLGEKDISWAINTGGTASFNDYINKLRLTEFTQRFEQKNHNQMSILDVALDCGFNSKSSFNLVFKRELGVTPSQYLKTRNSEPGRT
ncbi:AraC family transcriptional regulator [Psychrosphaera sp. B3R10]|uniref:helix-turn-helix domain-containing protein n=1 Tax=unclassified Psychrosphaera TaxID=2641570 RepID=UPI001C097285|nr:AraC family transcriptional regulator [Psychrosphaera sp. I2R16]MBU2989896.1 AraC family transcriptional regulator [Psychrosphaera sp. B3R10]